MTKKTIKDLFAMDAIKFKGRSITVAGLLTFMIVGGSFTWLIFNVSCSKDQGCNVKGVNPGLNVNIKGKLKD